MRKRSFRSGPDAPAPNSSYKLLFVLPWSHLMPLSDQEKQAMLIATHETALAFVDDIQHVREVISKPEPTPGDIRRISNPLRRILIDNNGDIKTVAPPELGGLNYLARTFSSLSDLAKSSPSRF